MSDPNPNIAHLVDPDEKEIEQKMIKTILGMPKAVQDRFKVLHMLSDKRSKLNDEFNDAVKKLEAKMEARKQPILDQRRQIISGEVIEFNQMIPKFEEAHMLLEKKVAAIVKTEEQKAEEAKEEKKVPTDVNYLKGQKGVPDFWFRAMKNNKLIWDSVKEKDEAILQCLKHVETVQEDDEDGNYTLSLNMHFQKDNDFFKPDTLSVKIIYESEDQVKEIKGTEIQWLEGKDPTKKKIKKKQKHKKTGETRTVVKTVDADSFFNVFQSRKIKTGEVAEGDSEEENQTQEKIEEVQQLVEDFGDLLIPDALEYYLGLNEDFDMMGSNGEESGEDGEDAEDSDEDKPQKSKKSEKEGEGGEQKQECKQQ